MKTQFSFLLASAMLLTACASVGPDYQQPEALTVDMRISPDVKTIAYEQQWWQRFDDPLLSTLVQQTLEHNYSLAAARANVERAMAQFDDADNDGWIKGDISAQVENSKSQQPAVSTERVYSHRYQTGANLHWALDVAGKLRRASESAYARAESAEADFQALRVSIVSSLASRYADYRGIQNKLLVAQRNDLILAETLQLIELRLQEGLASEFESSRIKAQQSAVKAAIVLLQSQLQKAQYDLALLSGFQANELPVDLSELVDYQSMPALQGPVAIGDASQLLLRRPDVRAAERRLAMTTAQIGVAKADLYPAINVSGFLGFVTGQSSQLNHDARAWSVVPSVSWQGLDWGSVQARIRAASASQREALAQYQQQMLVAINEAQSSLSAYSFSQQRLQHLADQQAAAQRSMVLADAEYRAGLSDLLDLLDAERSLLEAQSDYIDGQMQVMKDLVAVYQAFGGALGEQPQPATARLAF
ncbi:efflux transporter outer membrane subunit [Dasania sp. GY-MA-18]|uniref:Efflux transporter outer membrane subunit n=1 Tax=Dasania phycosphaerae TaxID=2950436 RepID=A0A9J6RH02_9GAMM|nr:MULTISPECIES: efflux transporter outer membrane subunit [Dasania]MCR8921295.1 efflux transporter outer membrane subunit [Dasania sp. GY-MA-18]MCZ0863723.1 efflux transporter outer membrane subunit [Dasania phycosphaerae]MCZ0867451.1 efflux transporter outer membrane subunit [Dasania phycosphaerae]